MTTRRPVIAGNWKMNLGARQGVEHSEPRARHGEAGESVNAKVHAALRNHITPMVCVGEELDVRRAGRHVDHTVSQVEEALADVAATDVAGLLVAYEQVSAIGTREVATPTDAQDVCDAIRGKIADLYDTDTAGQVRILYGGSVKPSTSADVVAQPDVDGALVGGASLDSDQLLAIWRAATTPSPI